MLLYNFVYFRSGEAESPVPLNVVRNLNDRLYEKRKLGKQHGREEAWRALISHRGIGVGTVDQRS